MEQDNNIDTELASGETAETESAGQEGTPAARVEAPSPEVFDKETGELGDKPQAQFSSEGTGMELLMDVHLEMTVELGRARLSIGEVMELTQGSVLELDKMAGEPVDVRINGLLLAQGEVIVMDDIFGVRITRLNQRVDRAQLLG